MSRVSASSGVGLTLLLLLGGGCGGAEPETKAPIAPVASAPAPIEAPSQPTLPEAIAPSQPNTARPKVGKLTAQDPTSQITVRSQPSTDASEVGFGAVGDEVTILESQTTEDGFTWHRVQFATTTQEGWIRGDFVELPTVLPISATPLAPASSAEEPSASANPVLAVLQETCGSPDRLNAYYTTRKYNIYICNAADGYRYVGHQKGTNETSVAKTVVASGQGFLAQNDTYRFTVDNQTLKVFEGDNPDPVVVESVESAQLYE